MPRRESDLRDLAVTHRGFPSNWQVWTLPVRAIALLVVVEVSWLAATAGSLDVLPGRSLRAFGLLLGVGIVFAELCDRTERIRRFLGGGTLWFDCLSVWIAAAILTLPPAWVSVLVAVMYAHSVLVGYRHDPPPLFKDIYSGAAIGLAAYLGAALFQAMVGSAGLATGRGALAAACGLVAFMIVNNLLIIAAMALASRSPFTGALLPSGQALVFEGSTLLLGALTGEVLARAIWFVVAIPFLLAVLQRSALVQQLQQEAQTDGKTGLLTANAWRDRAVATLRACGRRGQATAVLVIDLDHFKAINDRHGHLAGDRVLIEVAACLGRSVRGADTVGRFGGEEFVVVLPDTGPTAAMVAAERIREAVRDLDVDGIRLTTSIGVACAEPGSDDLDGLLGAADRALYVAKSEGRDAARATA